MRCDRVLIVRAPDHMRETKTVHWRIKRRQTANPRTVVCVLASPFSPEVSVTSPGHGWVTALLEDGVVVGSGSELFKFEACEHHVVMKDLCAECGANLRREGGVSGDRVQDATAKIPMVHSVPDLHVSEEVAAELALQEEQSLLASRKLILLVDLDQTILHTSNDLQAFKYKNLHRYCLPGSSLIYHTSFRPHLLAVLDCLSKYYEMHICTFGNRVYAHKLASIIDPKRRYFSHRILSRDECFNPITKFANLKALFPRGLNLVCIIDDRGEVWDWSPNLIHVKPYRFFPDTGDINAFPWTSSGSSRRLVEKPDVSDQSGTDVNSENSKSPVATGSGAAVYQTSEPPINSAKMESGSTTDPSVMESVKETCVHTNNDTTNADSSILTKSSQADNRIDNSNNSDPQTPNEPTAGTTSNSDLVANLEPTTQPSDQNPENGKKPTADNMSDAGAGDADDQVHAVTDADSSITTATVSPEQILEAADGNYLLRLQEILLAIHRSYYRSYDKWRARQAGSHQTHTYQDSDFDDESPSLSSTTTTSTTSSILRCTNRKRANLPLPHVADVIAQHRKRVLGSKCHITLSGLAPSNIPADRCLAGRIVRSLGAVLHFGLRLPPPVRSLGSGSSERNTVPDANNPNLLIEPVKPPAALYTTHLVACRRGTEKVRAAMDLIKATATETEKQPIYLVSPPWLWSCHFHWQHMPEEDFPLVHDFHPSEFDSEVEPVPGTHRYARRLRRHHHHHHHHHHHQKPHHQHHHHHHRHHDDQQHTTYLSPPENQESNQFDSHIAQIEAASSLNPIPECEGTPQRKQSRKSSSHRSRERHHNRRRKHRHRNPKHRARDSSEGVCSETAEPTYQTMELEQCLDIDTVRSALDSIRAERKRDRREQLRRKHSKSSPNLDLESGSIKRLRSLSDNFQPNENVNSAVDQKSADMTVPSTPVTLQSAGREDNEMTALVVESPDAESSSDSPSLTTSDSDTGEVAKLTQSADVSANSTVITTVGSGDSSSLSFSSVSLIRDEDEADSDESAMLDGEEGECDVVVDDEDVPSEQQAEGDCTETTCTEDGPPEEGDSDANLREFLPPPKTLILADNPLLHLPPQATSQMLAEIEDAVMEEETARAASIPAEAELYDPARILSGLDDSSSSSDSPPPECLIRGESPHRISSFCRDSNRSRARSATRSPNRMSLRNHPTVQPVDFDEQTCRWQVQRQLLLRRRCRASAAEVARIDKKLRRLDALFRRESRRQRRRSADDLTDTGPVPKRAVVSLAVVPDSESDDGDIWDTDYPKGWGPGDRPKRRLGNGHTNPFSASPAIHSDPEPSVNWWRSVQEEVDAADGQEWNTCPEGYDYADAERTRSMLRGDARQRDARTALYGDTNQRQGHVNLSQCLFGLDDEDDDIADEEEEEEDDGDLDEDEDALLEPQSSSGLSTEDDANEPTAGMEDLTGECWGPLREFM